MEANISTGKSKAFGVLIRYLQQSISLIIISYLANTNRIPCSESGRSMVKLITILAIISAVLNLLCIPYIFCKQKFGRAQFFLIYILSTILFIVSIIYSFITITKNQIQCAEIILLQKWAVFSSIRIIILGISILSLSLFWIQRYTNCPGNLTISYMFLSIGWYNFQKLAILAFSVGVCCVIITILSFFINIVSICTGITIGYKKFLKFWWIFALVAMGILQILIIVFYTITSFNNTFYNVLAKELFQGFLAINLVDLLFWIFGYWTTTYENGDLIRQELIKKEGDDKLSPPVVQYQNENPYERQQSLEDSRGLKRIRSLNK